LATLSLCHRASARALKKHAQDDNKPDHGDPPKQVSEDEEGVLDGDVQSPRIVSRPRRSCNGPFAWLLRCTPV